MYCENKKEEVSRYIFNLSEYIIMTNIPCYKCFNNQYKYKVNKFIPIKENKIEEWEKITATYLPITCNCKIN